MYYNEANTGMSYESYETVFRDPKYDIGKKHQRYGYFYGGYKKENRPIFEDEILKYCPEQMDAWIQVKDKFEV